MYGNVCVLHQLSADWPLLDSHDRTKCPHLGTHTQEHKALVVTGKVGDWVIHRCSNCETDVYVLHLLKELSRVFVTKNLKVGATPTSSLILEPPA